MYYDINYAFVNYKYDIAWPYSRSDRSRLMCSIAVLTLARSGIERRALSE